MCKNITIYIKLINSTKIIVPFINLVHSRKSPKNFDIYKLKDSGNKIVKSTERVIFSMATLILHTSTPSQFTLQPNTIPNPNFISLNLNFNKRSSRSTSSLRAANQDSNPQTPQGYISISLALYLLANLIFCTHSHHQMARLTIWELKLLFPS